MIIRKITLIIGVLVAFSAPLQAKDNALTKSILGNALEYVQQGLKESYKTIAVLAGAAALMIGARCLYRHYQIKKLEALLQQRLEALQERLENLQKRIE